MLTVVGHSKEELNDPFGILSGKRYEFILDIEVDEEDEIYSEHGLYLRVIYGQGDDQGKLIKYEIFERVTNRYLEFALEDDELEAVAAYCQEQLKQV